MNQTLVIIPTYNESQTIKALLDAVFEAVPEADVLVVDDHSPDGTGEIVRELAERDKRVYLLARPGKMGLGSAYIEGFRRALSSGYEYICQMDADFSHDPDYLPGLIRACDDADAAIGSRYVGGGAVESWPWPRRLLSRAGCWLARTVLRLGVSDATSGFRCYRRSVLEGLDLDAIAATGFAFQIEMTYRVEALGFRVVEHPITFSNRRKGSSKLSSAIIWEGLVTVWRLRRLHRRRRRENMRLSR